MTQKSENQSPLLSSLPGFERVAGVLDQLTVDDLANAMDGAINYVRDRKAADCAPSRDEAVGRVFIYLQAQAEGRDLEPSKGEPEMVKVQRLAPELCDPSLDRDRLPLLRVIARDGLATDQLESVAHKVERHLKEFGVSDASCQSAVLISVGELCRLMTAPKNSQPRKMEVEVENPIMKHFAYEHLPEHLQAVSKPVGELARLMDAELPNGPEKSAGLRKLLEAKDCLVRSALEGQG